MWEFISGIKPPQKRKIKFHTATSVKKALNTEPPIGASHQVLVIWLSSYREEDI
jgi:hypothetical protein